MTNKQLRQRFQVNLLKSEPEQAWVTQGTLDQVSLRPDCPAPRWITLCTGPTDWASAVNILNFHYDAYPNLRIVRVSRLNLDELVFFVSRQDTQDLTYLSNH